MRGSVPVNESVYIEVIAAILYKKNEYAVKK